MAALILLSGCACLKPHHQRGPDSADLEASARAQRLARAEAAVCERLRTEAPDEIELPFGYAEAGLSETGQVRLEDARHWLRCTAGGVVVLVVETEYHYRQPEVEAGLRRARAEAVVRRLAEADVDPDRIVTTPGVADGARQALVLRLRGRGW